MKNYYIKSALNYTGGKHKLLPQLFQQFPQPDTFNRFIDLFAGGGVVSVNVANEFFSSLFKEDGEIVVNDSEYHVIDFLEFLSQSKIEEILEKIYFYINKYGLSNTEKFGYAPYYIGDKKDVSAYNKEKYKILREDYNKHQNKQDENILFYLLIVFGFNNQIRFNSKGEYNLPVGKRDFNSQMKNKLIEFQKILSSHKFSFKKEDFRNVTDIKKGDFIYADPPYRISTATYNENNGWTLKDDLDLFDYLDKVDSIGAKFAMSNVIAHKGQYNKELIEWSKKYENKSPLRLIFNYNNSNYQSRAKKSETIEVLIKNY